MASNVFDYLYAVFAHWLTTFGGIAVLAFLLYEKYWKKETHAKVFWWTAFALLCVSFYQAWLDEHRNLQTVISEKAQLSSEAGGLQIRMEAKDAELLDKQSQIDWLRNHQIIQIAEPAVKAEHTPEHTHLYIANGAVPDEPYWPLSVGKRILINIGFQNVGDFTADDVVHAEGMLFPDVATILSTVESNKLYHKYIADASVTLSKLRGQGQTIAPHVAAFNYNTQLIEPPTQKMIQDILDRKTAICQAQRLQWRDRSGCYASDALLCLIAESGSPGYNWHRTIDRESPRKCL